MAQRQSEIIMLETHEECLSCLEKIRWNGVPKCPYCDSVKATAYKNAYRYRCNNCFTSYSVTVGTLFHKTHLELQKWFQAILLLRKLNPNISIRRLARDIKVNRATASLIIKRLQEADADQEELLKAIVCAFE